MRLRRTVRVQTAVVRIQDRCTATPLLLTDRLMARPSYQWGTLYLTHGRAEVAL